MPSHRVPPSTSTRAIARILLIALCLSALACAGGGGSGAPRSYKIDHEYTLAPGKKLHPGTQRALLFPMNVAFEAVAGLDVANDDLFRMMTEFLAAQGVTATRLSQREYARSSRIAVAKVRKQMMSGESGTVSDQIDLGKIIPLILEEIGSDAQVVILPNIVMRVAEYGGGRLLRWDGVVRRERGVGGGRSMSGRIKAGSLHTLIFDAEGDSVFNGFGGLDPIYEIKMAESKFQVRDDLFEDLENLQEGVCISFNPWIDTVDC